MKIQNKSIVWEFTFVSFSGDKYNSRDILVVRKHFIIDNNRKKLYLVGDGMGSKQLEFVRERVEKHP